MRVLGLVTARGGSKGVPRKNIREMNGKPLLAYTAEAAFDARSLSRVVLSTDDDAIAEVGRNWGMDVPFIRPGSLAQDTTPSIDVVIHAIAELEKAGDGFDAVCLLQPTNPLRRAEDIDACVELLVTSKADTVLSILPVPNEYNPKWVYWRSQAGSLSLVTGDNEPVPRRQELPPAYHRDGSVYVTRTSVIRERGTLYGDAVLGYEMRPEFSSNIDTEEDWCRVEKRLLGSRELQLI